MKTLNTKSDTLRPVALVATISWLTLGATGTYAQQYQYPSGYTPPRYTQAQRAQYQDSSASKPGVGDRLKSAGQNVGDFFRRSFYGEPARSVQQTNYSSGNGMSYQLAAKSTPPRGQGRYSLDAPPTARTTTGFQEPRASDKPKYTTTAKPKTVKKSSANPANTSAAKTTKQYTPSKPSTFSKPVTKKVEAEDLPPPSTEPTAPAHPKELPATAPQTEIIEAEKTKVAATTDTNYPLPGGLSDPSSDVPPPSSSDLNSDIPVEKLASPEVKKEIASSGSSSVSFMVGKKTSKPGRVVSPYAPYNELDITGLPSGSLALDPTTQKVFQVP